MLEQWDNGWEDKQANCRCNQGRECVRSHDVTCRDVELIQNKNAESSPIVATIFSTGVGVERR